MKLVILIIALFGAVSGDVSEIINSSREYLPPSREYLPPLLPEYLQSPPETSPYVQDPPIFTNVLEILSTVGPDNAASLTEEEVFIPVQVVVDNIADSVASLRQYLPPLIATPYSSAVLPQLSEETIENQTTPQAVLIADVTEAVTASPIQSKEFIESTTQDVISEVDNESAVTTEGASLLEANKEEDSEDIAIVEIKDTVVITTAVPDTVAPVTTESLDTVTEGEDSDGNDAGTLTTILTDSATESVTEVIQDVATTENTPAVTVPAAADTDNKESDVEDMQTISTTEGIEITTIDTAAAVEVRTEIATETIQTASTTDATEVTTSDSASVNTVTEVIQEVSVSEDTPVATTLAPVIAVTTESEPVNIQVISTTVPEYIQNAQKLQVATDETASESQDSGRSNDLEADEVTSEVAVAETKVSTPETLLLEDGYHYSIPSILFG